MSIGLALMGVSMGMSLLGGIQKEQGLNYQYELNEMKMELEKNQKKIESSKLIKSQYKSFTSFVGTQEKKNSSQKNYLNYLNVDKRSSLYGEIGRKQQFDYYKGEQQLSDNVKDLKDGLNMSLLSSDFNSSINQYNIGQSIQANRMNTVSSIVGQGSSMAMMMGG